MKACSLRLARYDFPDFDENTKRPLSTQTGTTGLPKGVYYSHRQLVLHSICRVGTVRYGGPRRGSRVTTSIMPDYADVSRPRLGFVPALAGSSRSIPGATGDAGQA